MGVGGLNEFELSLAAPGLQFLFACDGVENVGEVFVVDEARDVVAGGIGARAEFFVLPYAETKVVCEADVELQRAAGHDVDPEVVLAGRHGGRIAEMVEGEVWQRMGNAGPFGMTNKKDDEQKDDKLKALGASEGAVEVGHGFERNGFGAGLGGDGFGPGRS